MRLTIGIARVNTIFIPGCHATIDCCCPALLRSTNVNERATYVNTASCSHPFAEQPLSSACVSVSAVQSHRHIIYIAKRAKFYTPHMTVLAATATTIIIIIIIGLFSFGLMQSVGGKRPGSTRVVRTVFGFKFWTERFWATQF